MDMNQMPLMVALKERMKWLSENQRVISENVAHADTPGYKAQQLAKQDFSKLVDSFDQGGFQRVKPVTLSKPPSAGVGVRGGAAYDTQQVKGNEEKQTGNTVVLEEEMMKMAENQMQYNLAVQLYKKNISILKMASMKPK